LKESQSLSNHTAHSTDKLQRPKAACTIWVTTQKKDPGLIIEGCLKSLAECLVGVKKQDRGCHFVTIQKYGAPKTWVICLVQVAISYKVCKGLDNEVKCLKHSSKVLMWRPEPVSVGHRAVVLLLSTGPEQKACSSWRLAAWCSVTQVTPGPRERPSQPDAALVKLSRTLVIASISNSLFTTNKSIVLHREEVKQR